MTILDKLKRYATGHRGYDQFSTLPRVTEAKRKNPMLAPSIDGTEEYELVVKLGVTYRARPNSYDLMQAEQNARRRLVMTLYAEPMGVLEEVRAALHAGDRMLAFKLCDKLQDAMIGDKQ